MMGWLSPGLGALAVLLGVAAATRASRPRPVPGVEEWRVQEARRQSHALGFPFPEADGTLSQPEPRLANVLGVTGAEAATHLAMHLRRLAAEAGEGQTAWPATTPADPGHRPAHASPLPPSEHRAETEPAHAGPDAAPALATAPGQTLGDLLASGWIEVNGKRLTADDVRDLWLSSEQHRKGLRE